MIQPFLVYGSLRPGLGLVDLGVAEPTLRWLSCLDLPPWAMRVGVREDALLLLDAPRHELLLVPLPLLRAAAAGRLACERPEPLVQRIRLDEPEMPYEALASGDDLFVLRLPHQRGGALPLGARRRWLRPRRPAADWQLAPRLPDRCRRLCAPARRRNGFRGGCGLVLHRREPLRQPLRRGPPLRHRPGAAERRAAAPGCLPRCRQRRRPLPAPALLGPLRPGGGRAGRSGLCPAPPHRQPNRASARICKRTRARSSKSS